MPSAAVKYIPIDRFLENFFILSTGELLKLQPHQKRILNACFTPDTKGQLPFHLVVYSAPKKSGKSLMGAAIASWFAFGGLAERKSEIYFCCNDMEQSRSRSFKSLHDSINEQPALAERCQKVLDSGILLHDGTLIRPLANDYAGAAGSNPEMSLFDELWAFRTEGSRRLWEEMTPSPARRNSMRVVTTYAGFTGESELLEDIYNYAVHDKYRIFTDLPVYVRGDTFIYWETEPRMPWQTPEYYEKEKNQPGFRKSAYDRLHKNEWQSSENGMDMSMWDRCVELGQSVNYLMPPAPNKEIWLAAGVDCGLKKDRAAVTTCFKKDGRVWLGPRAWWQPKPGETLSIEDTIEKYLIWLANNYNLHVTYYDPWQMVRTEQELAKEGIVLTPFNQTKPNLIRMARNFVDLMQFGNLVMYPDRELRDEAAMVTIKELPELQGFRFVKDSDKKKIDSAISLTMAALAASEELPDETDFTGQIMSLHR